MFDQLYEKILNGLAKDMTIEDIANKHEVSVEELSRELQKGIKTEKEHTKNDSIAKEIAMDHLVEDPKYYTKLAKIEQSSFSSDRHN